MRNAWLPAAAWYRFFFHDPNGVQVELAFDADAEGVAPDSFVEVEAAGLGV